MLFRALGLFIAVLLYDGARAAECTYSAESSFLSRVVAIDSSNGPVYPARNGPGVHSAPSPLDLHDKEVVLTFDQGPHPAFTKYILDILDHHCAKATFFFTGSAALSHPDAVRDVAKRGHTLAAGPWAVSPDFASLSVEGAQTAVEKSFAAVAKTSGAPIAPFFRARTASAAPSTLGYLKERGVSLWFADIASGDTEQGLTPTQLANRTLLRIRETGKGVIQFHDTRKVTVDGLDSILSGLKLSGFKVVQIVPAASFAPKEEYLAALAPKPVHSPVSSSRTSRRLLDMARRRAGQSEESEPEVRHAARRGEFAE